MAFDKAEYMREYWKNNKEKINKQRKEYYEKNKEKIKEQKHNYYIRHKENCRESNREWIKNNRRKFYELCLKSRKKRVENLRAQGCTNAWRVVNNGDEPKFKKVSNNEKII